MQIWKYIWFINNIYVEKKLVNNAYIPLFIIWVPAWDQKLRRYISFILTIQAQEIRTKS